MSKFLNFSSSNPVLSDKVLKNAEKIFVIGSSNMTIRGTFYKFGFLLLMVLGSAFFTWNLFENGAVSTTHTLTIGGAIVGLVLALIMSFKPNASRYIAPAYALAEGFFLGGLSVVVNSLFEERYPNMVLQAVGLTFGVVISMYVLYVSRIIKVTQKFKAIVIGATMGIAVFYLLGWILSFFGVHIAILNATNESTFGIIFSLVVVAVAALNLILDFDRIEEYALNAAPKYMEWYCAFGLLVTIVWLYIEILKLLMRLASKKD